jgi:hypothetical protein
MLKKLYFIKLGDLSRLTSTGIFSWSSKVLHGGLNNIFIISLHFRRYGFGYEISAYNQYVYDENGLTERTSGGFSFLGATRKLRPRKLLPSSLQQYKQG